MAVKNASFGHFLLRIAGVTGFFAAVVGLVLWLAIGVPVGMIVAAAGGALVALAVLLDVPTLTHGMMSKRGAVGGTVVLQIILAVVLFAGVNVFSYFHYARLDLTRDHRFTLDQKWRDQLAKLNQDTTIVVYQRHTAFGQSPENPPDNYDAAAQRQIIERVKDLAEQFQDLGPRFRVEVLDSHDDSFEDRLNRYRREAPSLANAIEKTRENSIFFYAKPPAANKGFVQLLSYDDLFQLDRQASAGKGDGARNLVLRDQGVDAFAHKILNIQEKRPRIAFAVSHEFLGVDGHPFWGMMGVRNALQARGIDHVDLILKDLRNEPVVLTHDEHKYERIEAEVVKLESGVAELKRKVKMWSEMEVDFGKLTPEGNRALNKKYFWCDYKVTALQAGLIPGTVMQVRVWSDEPEIFSETELEDYRENEGWKEGRDYRRRVGREITPPEQKVYLEEAIRSTLPARKSQLARKSRDLEEQKKQIENLNVDRLYEQKRISDYQAKLNFVLADCDALIVPRFTFINPESGDLIPSKFHSLDPGQVDAVKDFMKAGKPVMFCLGPAFNSAERDPRDVEPSSDRFEADVAGDGIDAILRDLQVVMPAQVVLYDRAVESWGARREDKVLGTKTVQVPPIELGPVAHSVPHGRDKLAEPASLSPLRESLYVFAGGLGKESSKDLQLLYPRPVYLMTQIQGVTGKHVAGALGSVTSLGALSGLQAFGSLFNNTGPAPDESKVILSTAAESWNDDYPFPKGRDLPQPPEQLRKIPNKGTWLETRRGPFPVAIAAEAVVPLSWYKKSTDTPELVRFAVIGDGGIFKGGSLSPVREKLLLDVSNWLLGRDDLLARESREPWSFLRVDMSDRSKTIWAWSMGLGLPLFFVYLGTIVMLKRRLR